MRNSQDGNRRRSHRDNVYHGNDTLNRRPPPRHVAKVDCVGGGRADRARRVVARPTYGFSNHIHDAAHRRYFAGARVRPRCQHQRGAVHACPEHPARSPGSHSRHVERPPPPGGAHACDFRLCAAGGPRLVGSGEWTGRRDPIRERPSHHSRGITRARRKHRRYRLHGGRRGAESQRRVSLLPIRPGAGLPGLSVLRPARHQGHAVADARSAGGMGGAVERARNRPRDIRRPRHRAVRRDTGPSDLPVRLRRR